MRDPYPDRKTVMHQWRMGVDKTWCGGVARVRPKLLEETKKGLEKLLGGPCDVSVGIYDGFVYASGICSDSFHDMMQGYFEALEDFGDAIGETVIIKAHYGYFLNVRRWISDVKKEHFEEDESE